MWIKSWFTGSPRGLFLSKEEQNLSIGSLVRAEHMTNVQGNFAAHSLVITQGDVTREVYLCWGGQ
jgi:hypothetical protein